MQRKTSSENISNGGSRPKKKGEEKTLVAGEKKKETNSEKI